VALAEAQHGVITRWQALEQGMSRHAIAILVTAGTWEPLYRAVFRLAGSQRTMEQTLTAACLAAGPGAVASHRSAAYLHGFPGLPRWVEVTVPLPGQRRVEGLLVHRSRMEPADHAVVKGIPVTTVARTLIDVAGCVGEERLARVVDHALVNRLVRRSELAERAERLGRAGRKGAGVLGALLEARPESQRPMGFEFEGKLLRALTAARLPKPVPQFRVVLPNGGERFLDFAYPEVRLAIEADSYIWHASREAWEKDRERNNDLVALGWSFLLLTWDTVRYLPAEAATKVRDSLGARRVG